MSNLSINQAISNSLNGNYTIEAHLAYAKFGKDADGARTIKFRDVSFSFSKRKNERRPYKFFFFFLFLIFDVYKISVKLDEKPVDSQIKPSTPTSTTSPTGDVAPGFDDVGITRKSLSNNVILSYSSSDPSLFDTITYKTGAQSTTPTNSPTKSDSSSSLLGGEGSQKLEVAAKLTNSILKCNLSLENYHRLMFIIGQFIDPPNSPSPPPSSSSNISTSSSSTLFTSSGISSTSTYPPSSTSQLSPTKLNTSGLNVNVLNTSNNLNMSAMGMSAMGMSAMGMSAFGMNNNNNNNLGMSTMGMSSFGMSNLGSSILQFSAFFPPGANGNRTESAFFSNGNLMDSAIFGTVEESRLEKSILTKYLQTFSIYYGTI